MKIRVVEKVETCQYEHPLFGKCVLPLKHHPRSKSGMLEHEVKHKTKEVNEVTF